MNDLRFDIEHELQTMLLDAGFNLATRVRGVFEALNGQDGVARERILREAERDLTSMATFLLETIEEVGNIELCPGCGEPA